MQGGSQPVDGAKLTARPVIIVQAISTTASPVVSGIFIPPRGNTRRQPVSTTTSTTTTTTTEATTEEEVEETTQASTQPIFVPIVADISQTPGTSIAEAVTTAATLPVVVTALTNVTSNTEAPPTTRLHSNIAVIPLNFTFTGGSVNVNPDLGSGVAQEEVTTVATPPPLVSITGLASNETGGVVGPSDVLVFQPVASATTTTAITLLATTETTVLPPAEIPTETTTVQPVFVPIVAVESPTTEVILPMSTTGIPVEVPETTTIQAVVAEVADTTIATTVETPTSQFVTQPVTVATTTLRPVFVPIVIVNGGTTAASLVTNITSETAPADISEGEETEPPVVLEPLVTTSTLRTTIKTTTEPATTVSSRRPRVTWWQPPVIGVTSHATTRTRRGSTLAEVINTVGATMPQTTTRPTTRIATITSTPTTTTPAETLPVIIVLPPAVPTEAAPEEETMETTTVQNVTWANATWYVRNGLINGEIPPTNTNLTTTGSQPLIIMAQPLFAGDNGTVHVGGSSSVSGFSDGTFSEANATAIGGGVTINHVITNRVTTPYQPVTTEAITRRAKVTWWVPPAIGGQTTHRRGAATVAAASALPAVTSASRVTATLTTITQSTTSAAAASAVFVPIVAVNAETNPPPAATTAESIVVVPVTEVTVPVQNVTVNNATAVAGEFITNETATAGVSSVFVNGSSNFFDSFGGGGEVTVQTTTLPPLIPINARNWTALVGFENRQTSFGTTAGSILAAIDETINQNATPANPGVSGPLVGVIVQNSTNIGAETISGGNASLPVFVNGSSSFFDSFVGNATGITPDASSRNQSVIILVPPGAQTTTTTEASQLIVIPVTSATISAVSGDITLPAETTTVPAFAALALASLQNFTESLSNASVLVVTENVTNTTLEPPPLIPLTGILDQNALIGFNATNGTLINSEAVLHRTELNFQNDSDGLAPIFVTANSPGVITLSQISGGNASNSAASLMSSSNLFLTATMAPEVSNFTDSSYGVNYRTVKYLEHRLIVRIGPFGHGNSTSTTTQTPVMTAASAPVVAVVPSNMSAPAVTVPRQFRQLRRLSDTST